MPDKLPSFGQVTEFHTVPEPVSVTSFRRPGHLYAQEAANSALRAAVMQTLIAANGHKAKQTNQTCSSHQDSQALQIMQPVISADLDTFVPRAIKQPLIASRLTSVATDVTGDLRRPGHHHAQENLIAANGHEANNQTTPHRIKTHKRCNRCNR